MARKTAIDKLNAEIADILSEYAEDIQGNVDQIAEAMGKKAVKALKTKSRETFSGTGKYALGWKVQTEKTRLGAKVTLYNDHPGIPHLLENGHVSRNGTGRTFGQVPGREHIQPVADDLVETFEREVVSKL